MDIQHIAIEGNIGVGKTTLAKLLSKKLNYNLILEKFRNNYFLPLFYNDKERYALHVELSFFIDRLESLDMFQGDSKIISDYFFTKTLLFSRANLDKHSYKIFEKVYRQLEKKYKHPDLVIYLYRDTNFLVKNIIKRGRITESNIDIPYLKNIEKSYQRYFAKQSNQRVLYLDVGDINFLTNSTKIDLIIDQIKRKLPIGVTKVKIY